MVAPIMEYVTFRPIIGFDGFSDEYEELFYDVFYEVEKLISNPSVSGLSFYSSDGKTRFILHPSTRDGIDWQLSIFSTTSIENVYALGHLEYYDSLRDEKDCDYEIAESFHDLVGYITGRLADADTITEVEVLHFGFPQVC